MARGLRRIEPPNELPGSPEGAHESRHLLDPRPREESLEHLLLPDLGGMIPAYSDSTGPDADQDSEI